MSRPTEVKGVLQDVLPRLRPPRTKTTEKLQTAWREVIGEREAEQSRVRGLKKGVLLVEVDSAPMMHHISTKDKGKLIMELKGKVDGVYIKDLRIHLARE
jgi:hypothetical protein